MSNTDGNPDLTHVTLTLAEASDFLGCSTRSLSRALARRPVTRKNGKYPLRPICQCFARFVEEVSAEEKAKALSFDAGEQAAIAAALVRRWRGLPPQTPEALDREVEAMKAEAS